MKALVLSGGGALGAYEAGAIGAMQAGGVTFDLVCGTSIGALNASFVAQRAFPELAAVWAGIYDSRIITLLPQVAKMYDMVNHLIAFGHDATLKKVGDVLAAAHDVASLGPFSELLTQLGGIAPENIEKILETNLLYDNLKTAIVVSTTNLTMGASDAFYWFPDAAEGATFAKLHDKGDAHPLTKLNFATAVRASAAIPFAFAPVSIGIVGSGAVVDYVDGGVANNTPIGLAIDAGATDVTTIFLNPPQSTAPQQNANLVQIGLNCFGIMQQRILNLDYQAAQRVNKSIRSGRGGGVGSTEKERTEVKLRRIQPAQTLPISVLQFDNRIALAKAYALGLADGQTFVNDGCPES